MTEPALNGGIGMKRLLRYSTVSLVYAGPRDWGKYSSIRLWIRGSGNEMRLEIGTEPVKDGDYHAYTIREIPTEWREYVVPFSALKQGGYGKPTAFDPALVNRLYFVASSSIEGEKGFIELDDISLEQGRN